MHKQAYVISHRLIQNLILIMNHTALLTLKAAVFIFVHCVSIDSPTVTFVATVELYG